MPLRRTPQKASRIDDQGSDGDSESEFPGFPEKQKHSKMTESAAAEKRILALNRQRHQAKSKVQRIAATLEDPTKQISHPQLKVFAKGLHAAYNEYCRYHDKLTELLSEEEMEEHEDYYSVFEGIHQEVSTKVEELLDATRTPAILSNTPQVIIHQQPLKAPIPTFDGRYECWPKFKAMFLDVMDQSNDTDAIKLYHLDKALVGAAAGILDTKTVNENNYEHAWQILIERYENPRVIIDTHIRGLLSLKRMTTESHRELQNTSRTYGT